MDASLVLFTAATAATAAWGLWMAFFTRSYLQFAKVQGCKVYDDRSSFN